MEQITVSEAMICLLDYLKTNITVEDAFVGFAGALIDHSKMLNLIENLVWIGNDEEYEQYNNFVKHLRESHNQLHHVVSLKYKKRSYAEIKKPKTENEEKN